MQRRAEPGHHSWLATSVSPSPWLPRCPHQCVPSMAHMRTLWLQPFHQSKTGAEHPQNIPGMPTLAPAVLPRCPFPGEPQYHPNSCPLQLSCQASSLWRALGLPPPMPTLLWPSYQDGPTPSGPCPQAQDSSSSAQPAKVTRPHSLPRDDHTRDHSFKLRSSCSA